MGALPVRKPKKNYQHGSSKGTDFFNHFRFDKVQIILHFQHTHLLYLDCLLAEQHANNELKNRRKRKRKTALVRDNNKHLLYLILLKITQILENRSRIYFFASKILNNNNEKHMSIHTHI